MRIPQFAVALVVPLFSRGQVTFEQVYDHGPWDFGMRMQQTTDDGFILCGISWGDSTSGGMILVKADAAGNQEWSRIYATSDIDAAYCVRQTTDGGYVLCGEFHGFLGDTLMVIRTDAQGAIVWQHNFPGNVGRSIGYSIMQTQDGGFAVCSFNQDSGTSDAYVIKLPGDGTPRWTITLDFGADEYANGIRQLPDGGYVVLVDDGELSMPGIVRLVRMDSQGDTLWTRGYGSGQNLAARGLWANDDGGFIVAGSSGYPVRDNYLLRTDAQGCVIWERIFREPDRDEVTYDVQPLDDGGYILCGRKEGGRPIPRGQYVAVQSGPSWLG